MVHYEMGNTWASVPVAGSKSTTRDPSGNSQIVNGKDTSGNRKPGACPWSRSPQGLKPLLQNTHSVKTFPSTREDGSAAVPLIQSTFLNRGQKNWKKGTASGESGSPFLRDSSQSTPGLGTGREDHGAWGLQPRELSSQFPPGSYSHILMFYPSADPRMHKPARRLGTFRGRN